MKASDKPSPTLSHKRVKEVRVASENARLVDRIYRQLKKASPKSIGKTTGELAVDIGDLVFVGTKHRNDVRDLLKMRFPKDREKFFNLLAQFEVNLLFENQFHLSSMKRLLPRLLRDAYGSSNGRHLKKKK